MSDETTSRFWTRDFPKGGLLFALGSLSTATAAIWILKGPSTTTVPFLQSFFEGFFGAIGLWPALMLSLGVTVVGGMILLSSKARSAVVGLAATGLATVLLSVLLGVLRPEALLGGSLGVVAADFVFGMAGRIAGLGIVLSLVVVVAWRMRGQPEGDRPAKPGTRGQVAAALRAKEPVSVSAEEAAALVPDPPQAELPARAPQLSDDVRRSGGIPAGTQPLATSHDHSSRQDPSQAHGLSGTAAPAAGPGGAEPVDAHLASEATATGQRTSERGERDAGRPDAAQLTDASAAEHSPETVARAATPAAAPASSSEPEVRPLVAPLDTSAAGGPGRPSWEQAQLESEASGEEPDGADAVASEAVEEQRERPAMTISYSVPDEEAEEAEEAEDEEEEVAEDEAEEEADEEAEESEEEEAEGEAEEEADEYEDEEEAEDEAEEEADEYEDEEEAEDEAEEEADEYEDEEEAEESEEEEAEDEAEEEADEYEDEEEAEESEEEEAEDEAEEDADEYEDEEEAEESEEEVADENEQEEAAEEPESEAPAAEPASSRTRSAPPSMPSWEQPSLFAEGQDGEAAPTTEDDFVLAPEPAPAPAPPPAANRKAKAAGKPLDPARRETVVFDAGKLILERDHVAVSLLQRELDLDFKGATEVLDELQVRGLIGPYEGGSTRAILKSLDEWLESAPAR